MRINGLVVCLSVVFCVQPASASRMGTQLRMNPVRRVVTLLQSMAEKVSAEGKKADELFDKFMCYCEKGSGSLQKSIDEAEEKIPQLESSIKETAAEIAQLTSDVESGKKDREEAKSAVAEATALREKEAAAFAKEKADSETNLKAMTKAIAALEKGMGGSFLQTQSAAAARLRQLSINMDLGTVDREVLTSFLTGSSSDDYAPQSGEITGILKQMKDTMEKELADAIAAEESGISSFEAMNEAKTKEINALTEQIETKTARLGEAKVELVNFKEDLEDTSEALAQDKAFIAELEKSCGTKKQEHEHDQKMRAAEELAIAQTIKILNDDDALELFKKTLPSPSFLQIQVSSKEMKQAALAALRKGKSHSRNLNFIALALRGKKMSFEKVIGMIDDLVGLLKKEQVDDDNHKASCEADLDKAEDTYKELEVTISDLGKQTDAAKESVATLTDEIATLSEGIKVLDGQVADATAQRKAEHEEFVETLAADQAAAELLGIAKNRLNKFYNPKLYKAPPKTELSDEETVYASFGGKLTTPAPGGIANTGVSALEVGDADNEAPPPPPETMGAYAKKSEESQGVISMIDMLIGDLEKEVQEMEVEEKDGQEEYEEFMKDSSAKRAKDAQSIADKESAKADLEADLQNLAAETKSKKKEAMTTANLIKELHMACDWLMENFEVRKQARAEELDSLSNAKAVLSGADYS